MRISVFILSILVSLNSWAATVSSERQTSVMFQNKKQPITYRFYRPEKFSNQRIPVIICVGGLIVKAGEYAQGHTTECFNSKWLKFADEKGFAILGLGFLFDSQQWETQSSYQFPSVWAGKAALKILDNLSLGKYVNTRSLYLYGVSAGAQFVHRFALKNSYRVKAVAAHAAGGYSFPSKKVKTKFLITVGENDNEPIDRVNWAKEFVNKAQSKNMDVRLEIIPNIGHIQTEEQDEMSREFFEMCRDDRPIARKIK